MKRFVTLIFLILAVSCTDSSETTEMLSDDTIRLEIGGTVSMKYDPLNCQLSYTDSDSPQWTVISDNGSDFFILKLESVPTENLKTVKGSIRYTDFTSVNIINNIAFELVKLQGDTIWLWSDDNRICVVVRKLSI